LYQKTYYYDGLDRKKNHPLDTYYCEHTDNWLHLWSCQKFSASRSGHSMDAVPAYRIIRALVMEGTLGEEMGAKKK
jgi:hypothetical protein